MKTTLIAIIAASALTAAAPAFAGGRNHGGDWNGGHHHSGSWNSYHHGGSWRWNGSNWVWGAPLLGAAIAGAALAAPYYGYGGYGYAPSYYYPTQLFPPTRWCQNPYGGWFLC